MSTFWDLHISWKQNRQKPALAEHQGCIYHRWFGLRGWPWGHTTWHETGQRASAVSHAAHTARPGLFQDTFILWGVTGHCNVYAKCAEGYAVHAEGIRVCAEESKVDGASGMQTLLYSCYTECC